MFWRGSPHESRAMACVDCHLVHYGSPAERYAALSSSESRYGAPLTEHPGTKKPQPELCLQCHQMRRAQLQRSSSTLPYREGKVTCTSCHNPHGSPNPSQLIQNTINENCYSCHAERRGSGSVRKAEGTWHRYGESHVSFSQTFLTVSGQELNGSGEAHGEFEKRLGIFPVLTQAPSAGRAYISQAANALAANEFYKKGCQEKSSASSGGSSFFLEIQPTLFRYP